MKRKMFYFTGILVITLFGTFALAMATRVGYESAEYQVIESQGAIEIREYPDLMLAATNTALDAQGRDGSFMRLFKYISGGNKAGEKIAMTTPVFMEGELGDANVSMGFVMPKEVAEKGAPTPKGEKVQLRQRKGGRFAVIRFSGRLDSKLAKEQEAKLRNWLESRGLAGSDSVEAAGYDPPFTPSPLRRNEILIRLQDNSEASEDSPDSSNSKDNQ